MSTFLNADGIKSMLPTPSTAPSSISMLSSTNALTPAPAQFQSFQSTAPPRPAGLPVRLQYPTTLVTFVHEGELTRGVPKLLTLKGSSFSLEDASKRNLGQVFAVDARGSIRSALGSGPLLSSNGTCTGLQATRHQAGYAMTGWNFEPKPSGAFDVTITCNTGEISAQVLKRIAIENSTLVMTSGAAPGWYIVPIANV